MCVSGYGYVELVMERLLRRERSVKDLRLQTSTLAQEHDKRIRLLFRLTPEEFAFLMRSLQIHEVLAMTAVINRHSNYTTCKQFLLGYNRVMLLYRQLLQN